MGKSSEYRIRRALPRVQADAIVENARAGCGQAAGIGAGGFRNTLDPEREPEPQDTAWCCFGDMGTDEEARRLAAAVKLITAFGDPFTPPRQTKRAATLLAQLGDTDEAFRALAKNCSAFELEKDGRTRLDFTLGIQASNRNATIRPGEVFPLARLYTRDVHPQLGQNQIQEIVAVKLRALRAVESGLSWFDHLLMTIRRLVATKTGQRRHLLYAQEPEFYRKYILRYGPRLGRYYFACKTFGEARKTLRELPVLGAAGTLARAFARWMKGRA